MMNDFLRMLVDVQESPCVSVYLPLQAGAAHSEDNSKRLLSVLHEVETRLQGTGLSPKGQKQFLASARNFAEVDCKSMHDGGTVALFLTPSSFHTTLLLQTDVERITVAPRFYLTPLLPYILSAVRYAFLSVSKKNVHFYEVTGAQMVERIIDGMPQSLEDAWKGMERQEQSLHSHSTGNGTLAVHGQGGAKDVREQEEDQYMKALAKSVHTVVKESGRPLIFAGVAEAFGMFRTFDTSGRLLDRYVQGSPDAMQPEELKEKADAIAREHDEGRVGRFLEEYGALAGTGRTSTDMAAILDAALRGKVEVLLMAEGAEEWGLFNTESGAVTLHDHAEAGDEELIGLAAVHVIVHRGRLTAVSPDSMPEGARMAAVLRY